MAHEKGEVLAERDGPWSVTKERMLGLGQRQRTPMITLVLKQCFQLQSRKYASFSSGDRKRSMLGLME